MRRLVFQFFLITIVLSASTVLAVAQNASAAKPVSPAIKPGGIRITTRAPDTTNWIFTKSAPGRSMYVCRPLACAADVRVTFTMVPSPTRNPNPQALERFAKIDYPKRLAAANAAMSVLADRSDKVETLTAKVGTTLDRPTVLNETRYTRGKAVTFIDAALIFAGPVLITVQAASVDRAVASKYLAEFSSRLKLEDGPPLPTTPKPEEPKPAVSGDKI